MTLGGATRPRVAALAAAALIIITTYALVASGAPPVPVPSPVVNVRTQSGAVIREHVIPLGGAPVPIDVDERLLLGALWPDVDVSVGLVAVDELPGSPLVPHVQVKRDPTAVLRNAPAPPLRIDVTIGIQDAANSFDDLAEITFGYETPAGGLVPPDFRAKLIGPISGAFVDPLEARIETPGYSAPLKINAHVVTPGLDGRFAVAADPLPERIHFVEDPQEDGLEFAYDHDGPIPDVKLDLAADLHDRDSGRRRHMDARVERLPSAIELDYTSTAESTRVKYEHSSTLAAPDVEANYRDTRADGRVVADANVRVAGLPKQMAGTVDYVPVDGGGSQVDTVDFRVLKGGEIESLDFLARNFVGDAGPIPEPALGPAQFIAAATRPMADGSSRFRAAGRVLGVRSFRLERQAQDNQQVDVTTDIGDGAKPLRAIVDLDDRTQKGGRRLKVDTTVTPLPRTIHLNYDPSRDGGPTRLVYDSPQRVEVEADAVTADALGKDACGEADVTCLKARIDRLPPHIETTLPGSGGSDFSLTHTGPAGESPDLKAAIDRTPKEASGRSYAEVELDRIPNQVRGRLDMSNKDVLRAAEFHACDWDFAAASCRDAQAALARVAFTVRDQPARVGLPPRPDTTANHVTLLSRDPAFAVEGDDHFEVTGRVDEVRNVAFRQRDRDDDGESDGTLGVQVDIGSDKPAFDIDVDTAGFEADPDDPAFSLGDKTNRIHVHVNELPASFTACVRGQADARPPAPAELPADELLGDCDRTDVLRHAPGELATTPLSVAYRAAARTKVDASVVAVKPDADDGNRPAATELTATVDTVPRRLRTDVIPPVSPKPGVQGRKLQFAYDADDGDAGSADDVPRIAFELASRRADSLCGDPRPKRKAVCVGGELRDLPSFVSATYDPDEAVREIAFLAAAPAAGQEKKLSINPAPESAEPFRLSSVSPGEDPVVVEARIEDIASEVIGRISKVNLDAEGPAVSGSLATRLASCSDTVDNDGEDGADADDEDCEPDTARFSFDACPGVPREKLPTCVGVGKMTFTATNALVGDPVAPVPPPPAGVTQDFSFVEAGALFRAKGEINGFKQVTLDKLHPDGTPSETTKLRTAFGAGDGTDRIRAYVDRDLGKEVQKIDALIDEAPQAISLCIRSKVHPDDVRPELGFCERADASQKAIETALDRPIASGKLPDITVSDLVLSKGGGAQVLRGIAGREAVKIEDLGDTVEVLAGDDADLLVQGKGGADVAGRISFALQDFDGSLGPGFPRDPLRNTPQPATAPANFLTIIKARDNSQFMASVPNVKRIGTTAKPCDPADPRFPVRSAFTQAYRPEYLCVNAAAGQNEPLALTVRKVDRDGEILSVDDAGLDSVPGGEAGLSATIAKSPEIAEENKVCETVADAAQGCRPPFLSVAAPRSPGQVPHLHARLAKGPRFLVERLGQEPLIDELSKRLNYEEHFGSWGAPGARVKIGKRTNPVTKVGATALRAALKLELPRFLDLDPPTAYSCAHVVPDDRDDCDSDEVSADENKGVEAKDIAFKLVASNQAHGGRDLDTIGPNGRLALLVHNFDDNGQTVITGAAAATGEAGTTKFDAEKPNYPPVGAADLGLLLPGYIDARLYLRDHYRHDQPGQHAGNQQKYLQIDGRVNNPLNLTARLVSRDAQGSYGRNRDGDTVPSQQFTLRRAPCAGLPACGVHESETFDDPSFRIRAEVRTSPNLPPDDDECVGPEGDVQPLIACIITPDPEIRWLNVDVNANPDGFFPARTMEAIADSTSGKYEVRGFRDINDKSTNASISPQASLRMSPFVAGPRVGASAIVAKAYTQFLIDGDFIPRITGESVEQMLLTQRAHALGIKSKGGKTSVDTDLHGFFRSEVAFEVDLLFGTITVTTGFRSLSDQITLAFGSVCDDSADGYEASDNHFHVDNGKAYSVPHIEPTLKHAGPAAAIVLLLSPVVSDVLCHVWPDFVKHDPMITLLAPAPRWTEPGHPVPGVQEHDAPPEQDGLVPVDVARKDVFITQATTRCGIIQARTLEISAPLRVGGKGAIIPGTGSGPGGIVGGIGEVCDGKLVLDVERLVVKPTGEIDARGSGGIDHGTGTPGTGVGGGAGHGGAGGAAGGGSGAGGGIYGSAQSLKLGSIGRDGSGGVNGGSGGGLIDVAALETITVEGQGKILASGEAGGDAAGDCTVTGAGGGSGGTIRLIANKVTVASGAEVRADGGPGGAGGHGGGGGGGGRVVVESVIDKRDGLVSANLGQGGGSAEGCAPGAAGVGGPTNEGLELERAATVTRVGLSSNPWVQGRVELNLSAMQKKPAAGQPEGIDIIMCHRTRQWTQVEDPFGGPALDPPAGFTGKTARPRADARLDQVIDPTTPPPNPPGGECQLPMRISQADAGSDGEMFSRTFTYPPLERPPLANAYHGIWAYARSITNAADVQPRMPAKSTVKIGSDLQKPVINGLTRITGEPGCPQGSWCTDSPTARLGISVSDGDGSGVIESKCKVVPSPTFNQNCIPGGDVPIDLLADGYRLVDLRIKDQAGNVTTATEAGKTVSWTVDRRAPGMPEMKLEQVGTAVNGWHRERPKLTVQATDPAVFGDFSSGFEDEPITVLVDEADRSCPADASGQEQHEFGFTIRCSSADTDDFVPLVGEHSFRAFATDRLGNRSATRVTCSGSSTADACTMKVDTLAPDARFFIGPKRPDGNAGFYRTRPFFALAAFDQPGGSGVDLALEPSKIEYKLDGAGDYKVYDPELDETNRLGEGSHSVCFRATDVAGNVESQECSDTYTIDSTAPVASLAISPAAPDGTNGHYTSSPTVTPSGAEIVPAGLAAADTSGLEKVQYQIDGGPWTAAAPFKVPEGRHEIRARAFDRAGNAAAIAERVVSVDTAAPVAALASFPPRPNLLGYFRQPRRQIVTATDPAPGSGLAGAATSLDGGAELPYTGSVAVGAGEHVFSARARDLAGLLSAPASNTSKIDLDAPLPRIATPAPVFVLDGATLRYTVSDATTPAVRVSIHVFDALERFVRRIPVPGPTASNPYVANGSGNVRWNGRDDRGARVLPGLYHYRVEAVDQAGNAAISTDSATFLVLL